MRMRLIHNRNFMRLQTGWSLSYLGTQLQAFAFSLYILRKTGSAMQFALTLCMEIFPSLLLAPLSGYLADRWDRRRQIVCFDLLSAGVTALFLGWFEMKGSLPVAGVYLCVLLLAGLGEFTSTAASGLMQAVVPPADVAAQQTAGSVLRSLTAVAAPALGGVLFGFSGLAAALLLNAVSFLLCACLENLVRVPAAEIRPAANPEEKFIRRFLTAQREAMTYIRRSPFLQSFLLLVTALNFILPSADVGLMTLSQQIFAVSSAGIGAANAVIMSGMAVGALCANVGFRGRRVSLREAVQQTVMQTAGAFAACAVLLAAVSFGWLRPALGYGLFVALHAAIAVSCGFLSVRVSTEFQRSVDPHVIGRTSALTGAVSVGAAPLGQLVAGALLSLGPGAVLYGTESGFSGLTLFFARRITRVGSESAIIKAKTPAAADARKQAGQTAR